MFIARVAAVWFVTAVTLSHLIEPGIRVQKVTLAEDTPAPKFIPTDAEPHPVALFAHGYAGSKETLFRYLMHFLPCQVYNPLEMVSAYRILNVGRF